MKNHISSLLRLAIVTLAVFPAFALAAPTTGPYVTDPQNEYVQDATSEAIGTVNMVLCIMDAMNVSGSGMLNVGPYIALIDMNKCESHGSASGSTGGSSGASAATNYITAVVDATRASSTVPMVAKIWMSTTEQGQIRNIYVKVTATQSPTDVPPYGVFRIDYIGKNLAGVTLFNGFIDSASGTLQYYDTDIGSSNTTALTMTAGSTTSGSGTMTVGATTFNFNYNPSNFRRSDGTNDQCFDRLRANAKRSVWRMGTYNNSDGTRVDQANPGFPITATYGGNSYYGYAGYYGMGFQGLDLNGITDASPIIGLVATDQRPNNTTTYNVSKVGGKLTKWTQNATTLSAMDGIPFNFYGDLTGLTTDPVNVTGFANWQMQWKNSPAGFSVTGKQICGGNGCTLTTLTSPATVNTGAFNNMPISGWSDSFGGNINIPSSTVDHVSSDTVNYFSQSAVIPGSVSAPTALYCLSNCPDATSVGLAQTYTTGTAPSPFGGTTATQWFSAPSSANTVSYTFDAGGLKNAGTAMIINNASYYSASPQFMYGVQSGRLFNAITFCSGTSGPVCEPSAPSVYYTWSTGTGQWNQTMWLTKTSNSSVVAFDPPQNISYLVPNDATVYGTWANKTIQLQFNGFGNLYGIPGYCVNPVDNSPADCSTANARYVPEFSIPDGATMTLGSTTMIVKALDSELRLKNLGAGVVACNNTNMPLTSQTPPSGGVHDMSSSTDAFYIGVKPTVTASPKVIDGIVQ